MKGNHPKRRKDKYNPYFIISTTRNRGSETRRCYKKHIYIRVFKSAGIKSVYGKRFGTKIN